jgi:type II secretory pathway pseudopilin PulG
MAANYRRFRNRNLSDGFSLLELMIVLAIVMVVLGIAAPELVNAMRVARLRGAVTDYASLVQVQRIRALDDDRYYSTYFVLAAGNNPQMGYVDVYPQNANGTSGNGAGGAVDPRDPRAPIATDVSAQPAAAAPNTANLRAQVLPPNSPVVMRDGSAPGTPITFGPRGLPCLPTPTVGGTVCDSLGGPQAYWIFFQNNVSQSWGAVTISPAGRVARWYFNGAAPGTWINF